MPRNSNGLQVVRAQVRFFQSVPRSEETHDLSVVKQWIGWTSCKKIEKGLSIMIILLTLIPSLGYFFFLMNKQRSKD